MARKLIKKIKGRMATYDLYRDNSMPKNKLQMGTGNLLMVGSNMGNLNNWMNDHERILAKRELWEQQQRGASKKVIDDLKGYIKSHRSKW